MLLGDEVCGLQTRGKLGAVHLETDEKRTRRQADRQADRQTGRQTDRQKERDGVISDIAMLFSQFIEM